MENSSKHRKYKIVSRRFSLHQNLGKTVAFQLEYLYDGYIHLYSYIIVIYSFIYHIWWLYNYQHTIYIFSLVMGVVRNRIAQNSFDFRNLIKSFWFYKPVAVLKTMNMSVFQVGMIYASQTSICKKFLPTILQERLNYFSILFVGEDITK